MSISLATWLDSARLLWGQSRLAALAGAVFFMGFASAWVVVRYEIRVLMAFPLWFTRKMLALIEGRKEFLFFFCLIFGFNGAAMFIYLLSGLCPGLPAAVDFLTGMNIAIVLLRGDILSSPSSSANKEALPRVQTPIEKSRMLGQGGFLVIICSLVVLLLELPCFWFTIALGTSMDFTNTGRFTDAGFQQVILPRMLAYARIILPLLAVSAAAEAIAVLQSMKEGNRSTP